ncbi:MAG: hypothetical protein ABI844_10410, partial [Saprospiraceae bacterium]
MQNDKLITWYYFIKHPVLGIATIKTLQVVFVLLLLPCLVNASGSYHYDHMAPIIIKGKIVDDQGL